MDTSPGRRHSWLYSFYFIPLISMAFPATSCMTPSGENPPLMIGVDLKSNSSSGEKEAHELVADSLYGQTTNSTGSLMEFDGQNGGLFPKHRRQSAQNVTLKAGPALLRPRKDQINDGDLVISPEIIFDYVTNLMDGERGTAADLTCAGNCGGFHVTRCSCQSSCQALKTCCVDFFDVCVGSAFPQSQMDNDFTWLQDVALTCLHHDIVVASCRSDDLSAISLGGILAGNATREIVYQHMLSTTNPIKMMGLLQWASFFNMESPLSLELEWLLSNLVIDDTSTGISYKNAAVFTCNGGQWAKARPWQIGLSYQFTQLTSNSDISSLESLLSVVGKSGSFVSWNDMLHNPCFPEVVSSCPSYFDDIRVRQLCEQTSLGYHYRDKSGDPKSFLIFKNSYCQFCHVGLNTFDFIGPLVNPNGAIKQTTLLINTTNIGVSITTFYAHVLYSPAWRNLRCDFTKFVPEITEATGKLNMTLEESKEPLTSGRRSTSCKATRCVYEPVNIEVDEDGQCFLQLFIKLFFPPASRHVGDNEMKIIFFYSFNRMQVAMKDWDLRLISGSLSLERRRFLLKSFQIENVFIFVIKSRAYFDFTASMPRELGNLASIILDGSPFPFHHGVKFFCIQSSLVDYSSDTYVYSVPSLCMNISGTVTARSAAVTIFHSSIFLKNGKSELLCVLGFLLLKF